MMTKKSMGRQKIKMAKMEKESNLLVTFSKRRGGLFKKASELCILCDAEIAIVVFSPGKKVFSFGHPSVETVVDRFITQNPPPRSGTSKLVETHRNANIHELHNHLAIVNYQLEAEKNKSDDLTKMRKTGQENNWWEAPIESLGLQGLEQLKISMGMLKKKIDEQKNRHMTAAAANPLPIGSVYPHGVMPGYGHFGR